MMIWVCQEPDALRRSGYLIGNIANGFVISLLIKKAMQAIIFIHGFPCVSWIQHVNGMFFFPMEVGENIHQCHMMRNDDRVKGFNSPVRPVALQQKADKYIITPLPFGSMFRSQKKRNTKSTQ